MRSSLLPLAFLALIVPAAAKADTFIVTGSGAGFSTSATLFATKNTSTDPTLAGSYIITGINFPGFTLLPANNDGIFYTNDNLLFPNNPRQLDVSGFSFTENYMGSGPFTVNIFSSLAGYEALGFDPDGDFFDTPINFAVTANTPEPSSLILLGTGLAGAAAALRRKRIA